VLDRSPDSLWLFFEKHSSHQLKPAETTAALKLLEMQRHAMLMYTSCGWFFDELSGIETVQVLQYAGRMIQLAQETASADLEAEFVQRLALAQSNLPALGNGAQIYNRWVKPVFVDLSKVAAHFAISSMFDGDHVVPQYCYSVKTLDYRHAEAGTARLALGLSRVTSRITRESCEMGFAAVYLGDQTLHAGVRAITQSEDYDRLVAESLAAFSAGDFGELLRLLDDEFDGMPYSFQALFKDEQKRILDIVLSRTLHEAEASYHKIYERHGPLLRFLKEMGQPVPDVLRFTAEFVLNNDLKHTFETDPVDFVRVAMLMEMVKREGVQVDEAGVRYAAGNSLTRILRRLQRNPLDSETLERANALTSLYPMMPFSVDCWHAQNIYYSILDKVFPEMARRQDPDSRRWQERFLALGEKLRIRVPALAPVMELQRAS
jgi:hypothetical protein